MLHSKHETKFETIEHDAMISDENTETEGAYKVREALICTKVNKLLLD